MKIIGVVASPHKKGLTNRLLKEAMVGVSSVGMETEILYLSDFEVAPCQDWARKTCWVDDKCNYHDGAKVLNEKIARVDGIILGAPVYYLDVNGLTKNFMDRIRCSNSNGKPALGISMAGGTGKGFISALQSIYRFFFCLRLRGIDALPVTRFNYRSALKEARLRGEKLGKSSQERRPFRDLADQLTYYNSLPFMKYDIIGENLFLAQTLLENVKVGSSVFKEAQLEIVEAKRLISLGKKGETSSHIMAAYNKGVQIWNQTY